MPDVYSLSQIKAALEHLDPIVGIEKGFAAYSNGEADIPPVGEMILENPPGDLHIKYGCIKGHDYFVVKVATGFPENVRRGLPSGDGMMLVFSQKTGMLECVLLDEGHLTNVRTAAAGAVCAKYLGPQAVEGIGVLGAGVQGRLQVEYLSGITSCRDVYVWDVSEEIAELYRRDMDQKGYNTTVADSPSEIAVKCNLIITATPSNAPLLKASDIRPGTHITAMGSDTVEKQELESSVLAKADLVVADSKSQCLLRGEIHKAIETGDFHIEDSVELGEIVMNPVLGRRTEDQVTVADLTGVAVQDIQIATAVYRRLARNPLNGPFS